MLKLIKTLLLGACAICANGYQLDFSNINQLSIFNNALIIGGGDGLCAKRILEYPFKKVVQVEIDKYVSQLAEKYFKSQLENTFYDERLVLKEQDALQYFPSVEKYNFIALDLTDPQEDNQLSNNLFNDGKYTVNNALPLHDNTNAKNTPFNTNEILSLKLFI